MDKQKQINILLVDDDPGHLTTLETIFKSWGYLIKTATDGDKAVSLVKAEPVDLVLMDIKMKKLDGIQALKTIKPLKPDLPVLIMTAYSSVKSAVEAMKIGAHDYLMKPLDFEDLKIKVERALEHVNLKTENLKLKEELNKNVNKGTIIGKSRAMKELSDLIAMVAPSEATVLINGESGTGKELVARNIHYNSQRKDKPLVIVNCAALTETLLESELFGHEKGAFTGADTKREGKFMQANKGTIFLDEIGETSLAMQAKLLRVIQEREIQRVGSDKHLNVDVRIVTATNRDLEVDVREKKFREDLYYRLNVVTIQIPPLRNRNDDVPLLARHFLTKYTEKNRKNIHKISEVAMKLLEGYDWPGNVRELENTIERAVILAQSEIITEKELPLNMVRILESDQGTPDEKLHFKPFKPLEEVEKETILLALEKAGGNKSETARILKINRRTLYSKLKNYGITK